MISGEVMNMAVATTHEDALDMVRFETRGLIQARIASQLSEGRFNESIFRAAEGGASVESLSEVTGLPVEDIRRIVARGSNMTDIHAMMGN